MILDTSAILALIFREPEREKFLRKIGNAVVVGVGAPTLAESAIVLFGRSGTLGPMTPTQFVERAAIVVIPFAAVHWQVAAEAWLRFGRGRHPAALNLGDCFSYATARVAGRPLLCKGADFGRTDLELA